MYASEASQLKAVLERSVGESFDLCLVKNRGGYFSRVPMSFAM